MKIIGISDLHGYLPTLPECDVVCICGDISPLERDRNIMATAVWFGREFIPWAQNLPCKHVLFIAGNHDFFLEKMSNKDLRIALEGTKITQLRDSDKVIDGVLFYGTPWVENMPRWAFHLDSEQAEEKFSEIPRLCDVLLTHTPPFDTGDVGKVLESGYSSIDYGSPALQKALDLTDVRYALCGHVHSGNHNPYDWNGRKIVNVSIKNEGYNPHFKPFEFNL